MLRDSAVTAAAVELAANRIIDVAEPDIMLMVNGILVEEHVLAKVARARGVAPVTYGYGIHMNTIVHVVRRAAGAGLQERAAVGGDPRPRR